MGIECGDHSGPKERHQSTEREGVRPGQEAQPGLDFRSIMENAGNGSPAKRDGSGENPKQPGHEAVPGTNPIGKNQGER